MEQFLWVPGNGINLDSLDRLRSHFKRPVRPMGEAWFMGEQRHMFHELMGDISALSTFELDRALVEIASGTSSFGPYEEWTRWYHFLLGELLQRAHAGCSDTTPELLISGFMTIHPNGVHARPYKQHRDDLLRTLGQCMMDAHLWIGTEVAVGFLHRRASDDSSDNCCWLDASGDFSASIFFCLKYLPESMVSEWLQSALAIPSPYWRAHMLVWMVGAHDILTGKITWPSKLPNNAYPSVSWSWSHCLRPELATTDDSGAVPMGALLPDGSRTLALRLLKSHFNDDLYLDWLLSISGVQNLEEKLANIPAMFEKLYLDSNLM